MDTILGILPGENYSGIRALADLSMCVKYTNSALSGVGSNFGCLASALSSAPFQANNACSNCIFEQSIS